MKKLIFIVFLLLITVTKINADEKPKFFIVTYAVGDSSGKLTEAYLNNFEKQVTNLLQEKYPCVEISNSSKVRAILDLEREKELKGASDQETFQELAQSLNCKYLIVFKVSVFKNTASILSFCMDMKKVHTLVRIFQNIQFGKESLDVTDKISKGIVNGLKIYEICPFKGTIDITIISDKDTTITETYSVYCNNSDQTYRKEEVISEHTESTWNLEKKNLNWTDGDMHFHDEEYYDLTEENGCYKCKSGREGGRTYKVKKSYTVEGSGISHESVRDGEKQLDTRSELIFYNDSTYSLHVQGTSKPSNANEKNVISAEGTCDNISPQNKIIKKEVTVPLNLILGPFKGCALDKKLSQKNTIKTIDPNTKEKETITYEFNLKKD